MELQKSAELGEGRTYLGDHIAESIWCLLVEAKSYYPEPMFGKSLTFFFFFFFEFSYFLRWDLNSLPYRVKMMDVKKAICKK